MDEQTVTWDEGGVPRSARWRSESCARPPRAVVVADDRTGADAAYRAACEGTALLWRGDYHGARQVLAALSRRVERAASRGHEKAADMPEAFHRHRARQAQRARILGMLLVPLEGDSGGHRVPLRRAPDVREACEAAYGPADGRASLVSLRELQGLVGAQEWARRGVPVPALGGARVHPSYGVFSPVRGEYVDLVADAELPGDAAGLTAFDIGTGTGVLSAVLAHRGLRHVVATDLDDRALACARANVERLGHAGRVEVVRADLFPEGRAPLVVCNPPWVPAKATSPVERAVYDPGSGMLRAFLAGLADHLAPGGEGWLVLSDIAEHLRLRSREELLGWIEAGGLRVAGRTDVRPVHPKAQDPGDPLHAARAAEVTSLWRLTAG